MRRPGCQGRPVARDDRRTTVVSRSFPEFLTGLPPSDDFEFIGSSVAPFGTVAAYKTTLATGDAIGIASGMLREAGWQDIDTGTPPSSGFVTGAQPQMGMFCRDDQELNVMAAAVDSTTYVRLQLWPDIGPGPCEEMLGSSGGLVVESFGTAGGPGLYEHMPTLVIPDEATVFNPYGGYLIGPGGFSETARSVGTDVELETDLSARALLEHYGQQLEEQGWSRDTGWTGQSSSGSSWTRPSNGDLELAGLLDVVAISGSGYRASFRLPLLTAQ